MGSKRPLERGLNIEYRLHDFRSDRCHRLIEKEGALRLRNLTASIILIAFLLVWTLGAILLSAPFSHAAEIAGHWLSKNQTGNNVYFFFGPEDDFFIEDETSWIQGTYTIQPDSVPGQLDLYIQDGSTVEDVGKTVRYLYDIHNNLLKLSETDQGGADHPTTLEVVHPAGSSAFIGINTDPSDEEDEDDDTTWNAYATCFIMGLAGVFSSP